MTITYLRISNLFYEAPHYLLAIVLVSTLCGCGPEPGEVRGQIAGKVTFNGQPLTEAVILFRQSMQGVNMTAELKPDGGYEIITAKGPGLPLGEYEVCICPPPADHDLGPIRVSAAQRPRPDIPKKYRSFETSGLLLTVKEGDNPFDIDMEP